MPTEAQILLAYKVFEAEKAYTAAKNKMRDDENRNRAAVTAAFDNYRKKVAAALSIAESNLEFDSASVCIGNHLMQHCVYDTRSRWPCCVFCGSPRDGD